MKWRAKLPPLLRFVESISEEKTAGLFTRRYQWHEGFWLVFHSFGHAIRHRQEAADRELEAAKAW